MDNKQQKKGKTNPFVGLLIRIIVCVGFATLWTFTSFPTNLISTISILFGLYFFQRIYVAIRWEQRYGIPYSQRHDYQQILLKKQELKAQRLKEQELCTQILKEDEAQDSTDSQKKKKSHRNDYRKKRKKKLLNGEVAACGTPTADFSDENVVPDSIDDGGNNFLDTLFNVDGDSSTSFFIFDADYYGGGDGGGDFGDGSCDGGGGD